MRRQLFGRFRPLFARYPPEQGTGPYRPRRPLTWTCHVCGDERPDAQISVYSRTRRLYPGGIEATENVRYCNDRPECVAGAPHYHHIKGHGS